MATKQINQYTAAVTIDPANDYFLIDPGGTGNYNKINRNTVMGVTGIPADISSTQTFTNKVIGNTNSVTVKDSSFTLQNTGDTTKQAKFSLSSITTGNTRTYTLPDISDTLITLTATQTLTNKTLTSPVISAPTITNASISADSVVGFTTSNTGNIYGIAVSAGQITNAAIANGTISSTQIATNGVSASNLATNAITLGSAKITTNFTTTSTTVVQVTGLTTTVTIPTGGRQIRVSAYIPRAQVSTTTYFVGSIWDGAVGSGTQLIDSPVYNATANSGGSLVLSALVTPSAGSKTYNVGVFTLGASTLTASVSATSPAYILVEAI